MRPTWVYGAKWRRVRRLVLERDRYRCRVQGVGCRGRADQVDHIVPVEAGGAWYDPANLRAACGFCNRSREDQSRKTRLPAPSREW
jgi:5-methylcytosine-specific restriction protein A